MQLDQIARRWQQLTDPALHRNIDAGCLRRAAIEDNVHALQRTRIDTVRRDYANSGRRRAVRCVADGAGGATVGSGVAGKTAAPTGAGPHISSQCNDG